MKAIKGLRLDRPMWAKSLLVASLERDACDLMTDYFNHTTEEEIALAWSRHTRDLFPEMRKAAALLADTAHLGPAAPEKIEHREKWSMGGGYYLKATDRHGTGWKVSKRKYDLPLVLEPGEAGAFVRAVSA